MLQTKITFDPIIEEDTGNGWQFTSWDSEADPRGPQPVPVSYATLTLLFTAQKALFNTSVDVDAFFLAKARADEIAARTSSIDTRRTNLRTAEGLSATM